MWHVSIGLQPGPIPTRRWTNRQVKEAKDLAASLLEGAGHEWYPRLRPTCYHLRKKLTAEEITLLTPEWLALPAIDEAE